MVRAIRPNGEPLDLPYDDLIVAAGVQQSYFGHDEFAEHAPGMKTIADALAIRRRVFGAFELAESSSDPAERAAWLTFALVGAGPTGVELAGQIRELATKTLRREYRHIEPQDARVLLFDGGTAPLAAFGPKLSARAARALAGLGVEQRMQSVVTDIGHGWLEVRDRDGKQSRYQAGTVLWTAGVEAPPVARALADATGAPTDKAGRVQVTEDLTIAGHPEISVVGDMMSLHGLPGLAEVAMQSGLYAGHRIRRRVAGEPPAKPFRYRDLGSAAYIARGNAVVSAGPVHAQRLRRVGRLAADPPRLPDRHPEPARGDRHLVAGLRAGPAARTCLPGTRHRHAANGLPEPGAGRDGAAAPAVTVPDPALQAQSPGPDGDQEHHVKQQLEQ